MLSATMIDPLTVWPLTGETNCTTELGVGVGVARCRKRACALSNMPSSNSAIPPSAEKNEPRQAFTFAFLPRNRSESSLQNVGYFLAARSDRRAGDAVTKAKPLRGGAVYDFPYGPSRHAPAREQISLSALSGSVFPSGQVEDWNGLLMRSGRIPPRGQLTQPSAATPS
jgi:hypothetical protein